MAQAVRLGSLTEDERQQQQAALSALEMLGAKVSGNSWERTTIELRDEFRGDVRDLEQLRKVLGPSVLVLSNELASDDWIKLASQVANLRELHLYKVRITDEGLSQVAEHSKLEAVGLYHTRNSDRALIAFETLPQLKFVKLYGTPITPGGVNGFRNQAPTVQVDYRRGAFLGVGGHDDPEGCRIAAVHHGSPADKAGIVPGDIVTRFGGAPVRNFSGLTDLIAPHGHDEEVEVEIAREEATGNRRSVTLKVTLGAWELGPAISNLRR